jgi:hypothetical protein
MSNLQADPIRIRIIFGAFNDPVTVTGTDLDFDWVIARETILKRDH